MRCGTRQRHGGTASSASGDGWRRYTPLAHFFLWQRAELRPAGRMPGKSRFGPGMMEPPAGGGLTTASQPGRGEDRVGGHVVGDGAIQTYRRTGCTDDVCRWPSTHGVLEFTADGPPLHVMAGCRTISTPRDDRNGRYASQQQHCRLACGRKLRTSLRGGRPHAMDVPAPTSTPSRHASRRRPTCRYAT